VIPAADSPTTAEPTNRYLLRVRFLSASYQRRAINFHARLARRAIDLPFCSGRPSGRASRRYERWISRLRTCREGDCGAQAAACGGLRYYGAAAAAAHAGAHPHSPRPYPDPFARFRRSLSPDVSLELQLAARLHPLAHCVTAVTRGYDLTIGQNAMRNSGMHRRISCRKTKDVLGDVLGAARLHHRSNHYLILSLFIYPVLLSRL